MQRQPAPAQSAGPEEIAARHARAIGCRAACDRQHEKAPREGNVRWRVKSLLAYKAGKSALNAVTATLARDLGALGIRVNAVAPGMTHTTATKGMLETQFSHAGADHPMGRLPHADDIADVACFLLSKDALMVTGQIIDVDAGAHLVGGWSPYTPPPA